MSKTKGVRWKAKLKFRGQTLYSPTCDTKVEAQDHDRRMHELREYNPERLLEEYGAGAERTQRLPTFAQAVDLYRQRLRAKADSASARDRPVAKDNLSHAEGKLDLYVRHFGKSTPISAVEARDVEDFKVKRLRKVKSITVNKDINFLRRIFEGAEDRGWLTRGNPMRSVKRLSEDEYQGWEWITEEEARRLLLACRNGPDYLHPLVCLALYCGFRRSECLSLRWEDVRLDEEKVYIVRSIKRKKRRRQALDLHPPAVRSLTEWRMKSPPSNVYVFQRSDGTKVKYPRKAFSTALADAGIKAIRFHDLRHTFGSWLAMKNVGLNRISELMGHASIQSTMRYAHLRPEDLKDSLSVLPDVEGVTNGGTKGVQKGSGKVASFAEARRNANRDKDLG